MKNHYGSFNVPYQFHGNAFTPGVVGLNALDPIRARTRLLVGDVLTPEFRRDTTDYAVIGGQATLLTGTDPVALDRVGLKMVTERLARVGRDPHPVERWATQWLSEGQKRGLGIGDLDRIHVEHVQI